MGTVRYKINEQDGQEIVEELSQICPVIVTDIYTIEDNLHMNANGYKIWQKLLTPLLLSDEKPIANTNAGKVAGFKEDVRVLSKIY